MSGIDKWAVGISVSVFFWLLFLRLGAIEQAVREIELPAPQITVVATNTIIRETPVYQIPQYDVVTNFTLPWSGAVLLQEVRSE